MKNCVYCGTQLPDDALFCAVCGKKQEQESKDLIPLLEGKGSEKAHF